MRVSFRAKVLLIMTLITALALLVISLFYLSRTKQIVESNYIRSIWSVLSVATTSFDDKAREAYTVAVSLCFDQELIRKAEHYDAQKTSIHEALDISQHMKAYLSDNSIVESVYLYLPQRKQIITSIDYRAVQEIFYPYQHKWIAAPDKNNAGLAPYLVYDNINRTPKYMLAYSRTLYDDVGKEVATISVNIDERKLFYHCLHAINAIGADSYHLIDLDGCVVSTGSNVAIGSSLTEMSESFSSILDTDTTKMIRNTQDHFVASYRSPMTGFRIVCVTDREDLVFALKEQQQYIVVFLILMLLISTSMALYSSRRIYRPIENLKEAMQKVSMGDLTSRATVYSYDDIGQLSTGFNEMVTQIESLIDEVVLEQTKKREAELEALQYQITPHFMYNTLNSIKYAAYLEGNKRVGQLLGSFIDLLQTSINNKAVFLTVQEEVGMLRQYVDLQMFHSNNSFEVQFDLDCDAYGYYLPRLLLQPLVENAIIHGQDGREAGFCIVVSLHLVQNQLLLKVLDNGKGMDERQIKALMNGQYEQKGQFSKIGVANVLQRLELYYGNKASLHYTSQLGRGTKVEIALPLTLNPDKYRI